MMTMDELIKSTILLVDDSSENITLLNSILGEDYRVKVATNGENALKIAGTDSAIDLILLDIVMPQMDGYEVCRRLKANRATVDVPIIFLTAKSNIEDEKFGLSLGAVDYITKPISPSVVQARVYTQIQLKRAKDILKDQNEYLAEEVRRRTRQVQTIQDVTLVAMGSLAETRDNETGNHIRRTQRYVEILANAVSQISKFKSEFSHSEIEIMQKSAPLHDIGKVGIPDNILLKPGKLTEAEFDVMKKHTTLGKDAIAAAERILNSDVSFLNTARIIAWTHHEKWNGTGYPRGLAGESIPIAGRIMAVADVYDALISKRIYKAAMPHEEALSVIREGSGSHFDRDVAAAFFDIADEIKSVAANFTDVSAAL